MVLIIIRMTLIWSANNDVGTLIILMHQNMASLGFSRVRITHYYAHHLPTRKPPERARHKAFSEFTLIRRVQNTCACCPVDEWAHCMMTSIALILARQID
jgi:hypothetical protein